MKNYKEKFENMIEVINKDRKIKLLHINFGPPASKFILEKASEFFFNGLESKIIEFYSEINGLQIFWNYEDRINNETEFLPLLFLNKELKFDGVINFLPMEIFLHQHTWKGTVWFEDDKDIYTKFLGEEISIKIIRKKLLPFDLFSTDMSMAFFSNTINNYVLLLQDYHVDYTNSLITYFDDYISLVLKTNGLVKSRFRIFNALNGYRMPVEKAEQLIRKL
jgi:hypothetical protein